MQISETCRSDAGLLIPLTFFYPDGQAELNLIKAHKHGLFLFHHVHNSWFVEPRDARKLDRALAFSLPRRLKIDALILRAWVLRTLVALLAPASSLAKNTLGKLSARS